MKYKFTLIELLIVVAILGILTAMILPAIGSARTKSRLSHCKTNLRAIGYAVGIYYADGEGTSYPSQNSIASVNSENTVFDVDPQVITCPVRATDLSENIYVWAHGTHYTGLTSKKLANDARDEAHGDITLFKLHYLYEDGSVSTASSRE